MEIWKDVEGYEGLYQVSNEGNVRSLKKGIILKAANVNNGYLAVQLWDNGIPKMKLIHRLVAEAFIPNPDNLPQVNHKNEDKALNIVENLEWCSAKYNMNYGTAISRRVDKQSRQVEQLDSVTGELIRRWESTNECGRNGYTQSSVSQCCNGKRKQHKGYTWRFYQI